MCVCVYGQIFLTAEIFTLNYFFSLRIFQLLDRKKQNICNHDIPTIDA